MIKKILLYTVCLLPWFVTNILPLDYEYYDTIVKPFFAPPNYFYVISWTIIYFLIAFSIYSILTCYKIKEIPNSYKLTLFVNYLFNQGFSIVFFGLHHNFLGFVFCLGCFISSLFLYEEVSLLQIKKKYYLIPYILLNIFAVVLSLSITILN